jgi:hypothetical protein
MEGEHDALAQCMAMVSDLSIGVEIKLHWTHARGTT